VALVGFGMTLIRNHIVDIIPIKKKISLGGR
jgi:hypothetical protein